MSTVAQASLAKPQRGMNGQPVQRSRRSGGEPGMPESFTRGPRSRGNEPSSPRVYGCAARRRICSRDRLDDLPRVHDHHPVGDLEQQRQVVGDEQDREPESVLELEDLGQDLALDDHVERGRRLVHDHDLGLDRERHRDHHALAHAARELVRIAARGARGGSRPSRSARRSARAFARRRAGGGRRPRRAAGRRRAAPGSASSSRSGRRSRSRASAACASGWRSPRGRRRRSPRPAGRGR